MTVATAARQGRGTGAATAAVAGAMFLLFAIPTFLGAVPTGRPGLSTLEGLMLVPPVVCLGASGLARARRTGLPTPARVGGALIGVGAGLVVTSATALGTAGVTSPAASIGVIAFLAGGCLAGVGTVLLGPGHLAGRPTAPAAGIALVAWPGLAVVTAGAFVLFGVGSFVAAAVAPFGLALAVDGVSRLRRPATRERPAPSVDIAEP